MINFTIGADPEIFIKQNNNFKSIIGLIGGDKWHPVPLSEQGHAVLEDNVAVEFNIPPCDSVETFKKELTWTMDKIKTILPEGTEYSHESAVSFPKDQLNCEAAWLFGCEPDYDAWGMCENPKPVSDDQNLRSCGGHIHVGTDLDAVSVIRAMDLFLGVPSIKLDNGELRRKLYGKAGAFRFKPYGVEYRTLSNFWIFSDDLIAWAYSGVQKALQFVHDGKQIPDDDAKLIQQCINNSDMVAYEKLARTYGCV